MRLVNRNWILALGAILIGCGGDGFDYYIQDREVQGAISTLDPHDGGTYYDAYKVVALSSGEGIVNMEGHACSSCDETSSTTLDTELYIQRPNGASYASDDDSGGGTDARVRFAIEAGDEFRVIATTSTSTLTGKYKLNVSENLRIVERLAR